MYVCMLSQGLFELAAGLGYVIGYIIGGVLYEVCDLWGALGVHERCTYFANCKVRTCNLQCTKFTSFHDRTCLKEDYKGQNGWPQIETVTP